MLTYLEPEVRGKPQNLKEISWDFPIDFLPNLVKRNVKKDLQAVFVVDAVFLMTNQYMMMNSNDEATQIHLNPWELAFEAPSCPQWRPRCRSDRSGQLGGGELLRSNGP